MPVSRYWFLAFAIALVVLAGESAFPELPPPASARPARPDPMELIGKPPPPFVVSRWIKGPPLDRFEPGKVYVVDFWATWCGPCKAAIPRLTKLAKEHPGMIEVVGVSISERQDTPADTAYIDVVRRFVDAMGDRMDYRVAVDTPDKRMHSTWFKPTGTGGIPTAYIIGTNGLVAWTGIGTPAEVERIAIAVLAGTFDIGRETERERQSELDATKRSAADIATAKVRNAGTDGKFPGYREAMVRGDAAAALASLETAFKSDPASEIDAAYQWKLMLLLQRNKTAEVDRYARDLLERHGDNEDIMGFVSACIVATGQETRFDTQLAFETARRADAAAKPDTRWAQFSKWRLGWAQYHLGERDKAVVSVNTALANVRRLKATLDFGNLEAECEDALRLFDANAK